MIPVACNALLACCEVQLITGMHRQSIESGCILSSSEGMHHTDWKEKL